MDDFDIGFDEMDIDFDESPIKEKQEKKEEEEEDDWGDFDDDEDDGWGELEQSIDYDTKDLNKMTRENVEAHKKIMDVDFAKNYVKKGDNNYIYDKQVEFQQGEEKNEWDETLSLDDM